MIYRWVLLFSFCIPFLGYASDSPDYFDDDDGYAPYFSEDHYIYDDPLPPGYEPASFIEDEEDLKDLVFDDDDDYDIIFRTPSHLSNDDLILPYIESMPSVMVEGCVHALSGDLIISGTDLVVPGPKPLSVQRSWSSREKKWHFGQPCVTLGFSKTGHHVVAGYQDDLGSGMHFSGNLSSSLEPGKNLRVSSRVFKKGLTNCGLGEISGQTNWSNASICYGKKSNRKQLLFKHGSGVSRLFDLYRTKNMLKRVKCGKFRLIEEQHPEGIVFRHNYYNHNKLASIQGFNKNNELLQTLTIKENDHATLWESVAGNVSYRFDAKQRVDRIIPTQGVPIAFVYDDKDRIITIILPEDRSLHIEYYPHGDNKDKVKSLLNGSLVKTHSFFYSKDKTRVEDLRGNSTHYVQENKRLSQILRYDGDTLLSKEEFCWTPWGNLLSRSFEQKGQLFFKKNLEYDDFGNVTKEIFSGNLTGTGDTSYSKTIRSKRHLPVEESDGTLKVLLAYKQNTNLLESRLTRTEEKILKREFFEYDANGDLVQEILDDGSTADAENLADVTERHLKKITRTKIFPCGLPETIQEFCLDVPTNVYLPLKTTLCSYSEQGKKLQEKHYGSDGHLAYTLHWTYDSCGNVLSETDAGGHTIRYHYDANNNKISEERPEVVKTFVYDTGNRLIQEIETWPDGTTLKTVHRYNKNLREASIDPYGNETLYSYDTLGHVTEIIHSPLRIEKQTHDALGNQISATDPLGHITKTDYTARGQPFRIEHPDKSIEKKEYAPNGRLIKETAHNLETIYTRDAFGRITHTAVYDLSGNLLKSTSSTYNTFHLLSETDEEGTVTSYVYDSAGRKATAKKGDNFTQYVYDSLGRLAMTLECLDDKARVTKETYDTLNHLVEKKVEDSSGEIFTHELYAYDSLGNRIETTRFTTCGPSVTKTAYTPHRKPSSEEDPLGHKTHTIYDFHFPYQGLFVQKVTRIDPLGNQEITLFDADDNKLQKSFLDESTLLQQETYRYDLCHNLVSTTTLNGVTTEWEWDCMGREVRCTEAHNTNTLHEYNALGQKVKTKNPNGITLFFEYDALGRLASQKSSDGTIHYTFIYDKKDHILLAKNELTDKATLRTYDALGRLISETLETGTQFHFSYDPLNRLTLVILPDESSIHYHYTPCKLSSIERIGPQCYEHHYLSYDLSGNSTCEEFFNGGLLTCSLDLLHRPIAIKAPHRAEHLSYNQVGDLVSRTVNTHTTHYSYDALHQLIHEADTEKNSHNYRYDSESNCIEKNGNSYAVNPLNQITSENGITYLYDQNGNLIKKHEENECTEYRYDALNRLIAVQNPHFSASYSYDAFHRRLKKSVNGQEEHFLYQNQSEIGSIVDNTLKELRILGQGLSADISATVAIELNNAVYAPLHDSSGTIVLLLDSDSHPSNPFSATAFGEIISLPSQNPWLYSSKRFDPETGFFYFGKRYYNPSLGRWITKDPAGFADGLNLYAYVHNSPLTHIDPDGQFAFLIPIVICTALEYALPVVATGLEGYAGGAYAAAFLTGALNGYNYNFTAETYSPDLGLGICEKAGLAFGAVMSLSPTKVTSNIGSKTAGLVTNIVQKEFTENVVRQVTRKTESWCANYTARRITAQTTTKAIDKTSRFAAGRGIVAKERVLNEKSIWTPGKRGNPVRNAFLHWKDHGHEFSGLQNSRQYVEQAHNLFRDPSVLRRIRSSDGSCLRYDPLTNTFGSFTAEGIPKTMFKPGISKPMHSKYSNPMEYFYGQ